MSPDCDYCDTSIGEYEGDDEIECDMCVDLFCDDCTNYCHICSKTACDNCVINPENHREYLDGIGGFGFADDGRGKCLECGSSKRTGNIQGHSRCLECGNSQFEIGWWWCCVADGSSLDGHNYVSGTRNEGNYTNRDKMICSSCDCPVCGCGNLPGSFSDQAKKVPEHLREHSALTSQYYQKPSKS